MALLACCGCGNGAARRAAARLQRVAIRVSVCKPAWPLHPLNPLSLSFSVWMGTSALYHHRGRGDIFIYDAEFPQR